MTPLRSPKVARSAFASGFTSIRAMAEMVRRQNGVRTMLATEGGAQDSLLVEAMGTLVDALAAELGPRVRTGHRVTAVVRDDGGLTIRTTAGDIRTAKAIVTVPPPMLDRIAFDPPLPASRSAIVRNSYMGIVYKAIAVYDRPFWRERKGGDFIVLDRPGRAVFDSSAPDGPGHLCVLVPGPEARDLDALDAESRRDIVLRPLVHHIGPEVLEPVSWHEKSWQLDEFVGGGYLALPEAGTTDGFLPVSSIPTGDIHWAGTETAEHHPGYLDGAVESGLRVAREVADVLSPADSGVGSR